MKIWKIIVGILGTIGALFAVSSKSKEVKKLKGVIKENKKKELVIFNNKPQKK